MFKLNMPVCARGAGNIYFSTLCATMPHRSILRKAGYSPVVQFKLPVGIGQCAFKTTTRNQFRSSGIARLPGSLQRLLCTIFIL